MIGELSPQLLQFHSHFATKKYWYSFFTVIVRNRDKTNSKQIGFYTIYLLRYFFLLTIKKHES